MRWLATTCAALTIAVAGCFGRPDIGRLHIDPATGEEVVSNFKVPRPGDADFVGPVITPDQSFSQGKQDAKADFNKTVSWATSIALWIFIPLAILVALASFVVAWIPTKASIYCAGAACAVVGIRYALLAFGVIAIDWAVYISAASAIIVGLFVGLPMLIAYIKRNTWKRGVAMAAEGSHVEGAVAVLASVDPAIDAARKQVDTWLEIFHRGDKESPVWTEAKMQLTKMGVMK
jgi:hypothetical protein